MPKITNELEYPKVTEVKQDDVLLGVQDGAVRQFPAEVIGGGGASVYDLVIRTQAEFEDMITDGRELTNTNIQTSTWKGAKSVALVGEFVLDFAGNEGIKRPSTVTRIDGFNNAKITVTNFVFDYGTSNGGLYNESVGSARCHISNLTVDCTGAGDGYGFNGPNNTYTNCTGTGTGAGFSGSNNSYINCTGTGAGTYEGYGYGFSGSNNSYINCTGTGAGTYEGYGFFGSNNSYTNCTGTGAGTGAGTGFFGSNNSYTNCTGEGTGDYDAGTGFYGGNNRIISCTALAYVSGTPGTTNCVPIRNSLTTSNLFMIIKNCKFPQIEKAGYNQGTIWCNIANNTEMKGAIKDNIYHSRFTDDVIAGAGVEQENNQAVDITTL